MLRKCVLALVLSASLTAGLAARGAETDAGKILKAAGLRAGVCVHLGVTDGKLTAGLSGGGKLVVHGLAADAASVEKARKHIGAQGLYGQVSVERADMKKLACADNLVNLAVAEDLPALLAKGLSLKEVFRVLTPGGVLCSRTGADAAKLRAAGFSDVKSSGGWTLAAKPVPKEMDGWPCFDYGPEGNPVSGDTLAGPGTSLRWRIPMYSRHCSDVFRAWVSAGGRMFYCRRKLLPDGYRVRVLLTARDAYNGQLLWEKPVKWMIGSKYGDRNVVATEDRLYLPLEPKGPIVALDAATGELVQTYKGTGRPDQLMLLNGKLIGGNWASSWGVDVKSGQQVWSQRKIGGQFVFADGQLLYGDVYAQPRKIMSLNPDSGKVNWEAPGGGVNLYNGPFYYKGTLVLQKGLRKPRYGLTVEGYSSKDGKKLWGGIPESGSILRRGGCYMGEVFGAQGLVWIHAVVKKNPEKKNTGKRPSAWIGVDPKTGEIKKRYDDATSDPDVYKMLAGGTHRCNRGRATERGYLFGTFEFYEWKTGKYHGSSATRSHCGIGTGLLPANGLIYAPPPTCVCRQFMQRGGFTAFAHRPGGVKVEESGRLQRGSGSGGGGAAAPGDWPCYRKDPARLGATDVAVPPNVAQLWERKLGRSLTAPVIAGGRVLVASEADHRVTALNSSNGKVLWSFTAGGRIDSPPTVSGGLAIFGCRDGKVYCLSAATGKLVWRYRVAPLEERVMVDGQLESPWPVHGSLPVAGGTVYAAAGWHTALDGGVTLCALKAGSGGLVWKKRLEKLPGSVRYADGPVALLTTDGKFLYMGRSSFDLKTGAKGSSRGRPRAMNFGLSSFRDNDWPQFSNHKGRLRWNDGRVSGELLSSGKVLTCGVAVGFRGRDDGPLAGAGAYKLFGKKGRTGAGWSVSVPLVPRALVLAGGTLFVAGQPDPEIPELKGVKDYRRRLKLGAELMEKREAPQGGELWACSAADGKRLHSVKLPAPPVFDGMAAAGGKLYLSTTDGKLRCFGKK